MTHDNKTLIQNLVQQAITHIAPNTDISFTIERSKQAQHGDFACNAAMQLARTLRQNPRDIASQLQAALPPDARISKTETAGAGFINFFLSDSARWQVVPLAQIAGAAFGRHTQENPKNIQIEFVSANPTGPLHVGHGRGAAYGASLANVLEAAGFKVCQEYYINDAGRQMDILALSTWLRYLESLGAPKLLPSNAYQGDYVCNMAAQLHQQYDAQFNRPVTEVLSDVPAMPDAQDSSPEAKQRREQHLDALIGNAKRLLGQDYTVIHHFALNTQLAGCKQDLSAFGVDFDVWYSEQSLFDRGFVAKAVETLEANGHLYTQDGAKWFRSTAFGDEKDRVVQRDNGLYTYFASDIAYHLHKFERGFDTVINVWGADHHGYIARVKGALQALGQNPDRLEIALVQFAVLWRNGVQAKMSTRSGDFVTLQELREEVGNDAARFFYVLRKSDQHLDFDLDLAKSQSNDNPVYYIQYAHARICRVREDYTKQGGDLSRLPEADLSLLQHPAEQQILRRLNEYSDTIATAARDYAPHIIAFYLKDLAADLHSYYSAEKWLVEDTHLSQARLSLISAVRQVIANGLSLLGVSAPEKM